MAERYTEHLPHLQKRPSRDSVRRLLARVLPTDSELEAFCSDHFPAAAHEWGSDMNRTRKESLLLAAAEVTAIVERLSTVHPERFARFEHLLAPEVAFTRVKRPAAIVAVLLVAVAVVGVAVNHGLGSSPAPAPPPQEPAQPAYLVPPPEAPTSTPSPAKQPEPTPMPGEGRPDAPKRPKAPDSTYTLKVRSREGEKLTICRRGMDCDHPTPIFARPHGDVDYAVFKNLRRGDYVVTCTRGPSTSTVDVSVPRTESDDVRCFAPL